MPVSVLKLGGSALETPAATRAMLDAVAALHSRGLRLVLVHGGGKPIDRAMDAAGLISVKIQGRRYTDDATLAVVVRVLHEIGSSLVAELESRDVPAELIRSGIRGRRLLLPGLDLQPLELGRVGEVTGVVVKNWNSEKIPIIPSLAHDEIDGDWLNINADSMAAGVAKSVGAESVLFLTDTPGVLKDRANPASRCSRLTIDECRNLMNSGIIDGGMIPKVEACFEALDAGAKRAVILDGRDPNSIRNDFDSPGSTGTEIVA